MPTIEKRPLPPIGAGSVTISPSDKDEIMSRARDVIDHYMSGEGSWWDEGPRKSAHETIDDLKRFKDSVLATEQYLDDPSSVWPSVKEMIDSAIEQTGQAIPNLENNSASEIRPVDPRDSINRAVPPILAPPTNGRVRILAAPTNQDLRVTPNTTQSNRSLVAPQIPKVSRPNDPDIRILRRVVRD
ncbi:hypothetical protein ACU4GH_25340 [Bradyrhizobium betae]